MAGAPPSASAGTPNVIPPRLLEELPQLPGLPTVPLATLAAGSTLAANNALSVALGGFGTLPIGGAGTVLGTLAAAGLLPALSNPMATAGLLPSLLSPSFLPPTTTPVVVPPKNLAAKPFQPITPQALHAANVPACQPTLAAAIPQSALQLPLTTPLVLSSSGNSMPSGLTTSSMTLTSSTLDAAKLAGKPAASEFAALDLVDFAMGAPLPESIVTTPEDTIKVVAEKPPPVLANASGLAVLSIGESGATKKGTAPPPPPEGVGPVLPSASRTSLQEPVQAVNAALPLLAPAHAEDVAQSHIDSKADAPMLQPSTQGLSEVIQPASLEVEKAAIQSLGEAAEAMKKQLMESLKDVEQMALQTAEDVAAQEKEQIEAKEKMEKELYAKAIEDAAAEIVAKKREAEEAKRRAVEKNAKRDKRSSSTSTSSSSSRSRSRRRSRDRRRHRKQSRKRRRGRKSRSADRDHKKKVDRTRSRSRSQRRNAKKTTKADTTPSSQKPNAPFVPDWLQDIDLGRFNANNPVVVKPKNYKTVLCRHFQFDSCKSGINCNFIHEKGAAPQPNAPPPTIAPNAAMIAAAQLAPPPKATMLAMHSPGNPLPPPPPPPPPPVSSAVSQLLTPPPGAPPPFNIS